MLLQAGLGSQAALVALGPFASQRWAIALGTVAGRASMTKVTEITRVFSIGQGPEVAGDTVAPQIRQIAGDVGPKGDAVVLNLPLSWAGLENL